MSCGISLSGVMPLDFVLYKETMKNALKVKVVNGKYTLPVILLVYLTGFFLLRSDVEKVFDAGIVWDALYSHFPVLFSSKWISLLLHAIFVYLILELDALFALSRTRTTFHISSFLLLLTVCPFIFDISPYLLAALMIVLSLFPLFFSYQLKESSPRMFYVGLYFSISTLLVPSFFWMFPVYLIAIANIGIFNVRNFFSWLWGALLPYGFIYSYCYCFDSMSVLDNLWKDIYKAFPLDYSSMSLSVIINASAILFIVFSSFGHLFYTSYMDKIKTRIFLYILSLFPFFMFLIAVFRPLSFIDIISVALPFVSIMMAHMLCHTDSRNGNVFFYFVIILLSSLMVFNIYNIYA